MSDNNNETRKERYRSKSRSSMIVKLAVGLTGLIFVAVIFNYFLGGSADDKNQVAGANDKNEFSMIKKNPSSESSSESVSQTEESSSQEDEKEKEKDKEKDKEEDLDKKEVESNDSNVKKAVVANWEPIGTKQSEPHVVVYDDGSQDRQEIKEAVSQATGVPANDMVENWIGNDGEQKVTSTITQNSTGHIYKVYLKWVENKGWKVNRVEELHTVIR